MQKIKAKKRNNKCHNEGSKGLTSFAISCLVCGGHWAEIPGIDLFVPADRHVAPHSKRERQPNRDGCIEGSKKTTSSSPRHETRCRAGHSCCGAAIDSARAPNRRTRALVICKLVRLLHTSRQFPDGVSSGTSGQSGPM